MTNRLPFVANIIIAVILMIVASGVTDTAFTTLNTYWAFFRDFCMVCGALYFADAWDQYFGKDS